MLKINDITVQYENNNPTIEGFNLEVGQGEIVAIVGESGSGKTTVIRSVLGLLPGKGKVTKGDIIFEDDSLLNYTEKQWNEIRGTKMSMIFQDCGSMINPNRRIGSQFIEYILVHKKMPKDEAKKKAIEMLDKMRLPQAEQIMKKYPFQLSGGQRQRVGIAIAMTFQPKLLIADEPTSALDVTTQSQIVREMIDLRDKYNTSIMIVTHNLAVAAYMADKIIVMKDGVVVDRGTREDILKNPNSDYTKRLLASVPTWREEQYA
ncbi:ABC transporter ATP-binding protein [Intestinibacter sp.]|uniref:ABC transporter ATP-binding protein n=1 Tax=Intestinibacter sp. TaxID=1965304 RepID=UPI002A7646E6|nr:ABC transporter ATP-binding protein [Intestinibacter sp.]MDY2735314.1 ABC transporter ATP-binding protein [Intestinibacter sp.]MDY4575879.1 ABC transporter ATP-binding protein [Intestinibacter sp.]